ncbi:MAG: hypothetical protein N3B13_06935, partial [Deltaproteobacteria bacterium]|nr:hypothetical protein [Deltaproteobacteria bacterium]
MRYLAKLFLVTVILCAANIYSLYPFSVNLSDSAPDNPDDVLLNSFIMQWEYENIISGNFKDYFNTPYYYPYKNTLAYTEHHTVSQIFFFPLFSILKNNVLVHNIMIMLLLVLAGLTTFILFNYFTNSFFASLLGAVLFTFVPYRYTHLVHLNVLHWWIIPLIFLGFYVFVKRLNIKNAVLFGTSILLMLLWSNNISAFLIVPFTIYALFVTVENRLIFDKKFYLYSIIVFVIVLIIASPFLIHYIRLREEMFFERFLFDIRYYSPQIKNFLGVHKTNILWGDILGENGKWECYLFPGITFIVLFCLSVLFAYFSRYRKYILLFSFIAIVTTLLSFGPTFDGLKGEIKGPYYILLKYFPGYYGIRVPARFAIFTYLSMAMASSLFVSDIHFRLKNNKICYIIFSTVVLLVTAFCVYEGSHRIEIKRPLNHPEKDPLYTKLRGLEEGALFEHPSFVAYKDASHVYATLYHRKPTVNGYSGWNSKVLENLKDAVHNYHPVYLIKALKDLNIKYFILRGNISTDIYNRMSKLEEYDKGVTKILVNGRDILYKIDSYMLKEFDFYNLDIKSAEFYLPSCMKRGNVINGGIVIGDTENFSFSQRRRYPIYLVFINQQSGKRIEVASDVVAYRYYNPGSIHLLIKLKPEISEGVYSVYYKGITLKDSVSVKDACSDVISEKIEVSDFNLPDNLSEGEPVELNFILKNNERYLK